MASLQNAQIDQSYQGLIKTADNTSTAPFPPQPLQYGDGTDLPIKLGDGSGVGLGDMITIQSGTKFLEIHSQGVSLGGLSTVDAQAGTASIVNGTFNFGNPNPAITTNVDFTNATVTGLPSSGGSSTYGPIGGTGAKGYIRYDGGTNNYKTNQLLSGYNLTAAGSANDRAYYQIIGVEPGDTISELLLSVQTAVAATTAQVAFYDLGIDAGGGLYVNDQLLDLGNIDTSTTGDKVITLGTPFTMPTGKLNNQIAILVFRSDNSVAMKGWSQVVHAGFGGSQNGGIYYRSLSPNVDPGVSPGTALPANIGTSGITYGAQTSNPLMILYK